MSSAESAEAKGKNQAKDKTGGAVNTVRQLLSERGHFRLWQILLQKPKIEQP
jgi:hypothetical protein